MEARRADVDVLGLDPLLGEHPLQRLLNGRFACRFLRPFSPERLQAVLLQPQPARLVDFELRQLETAGPKINGEK